MGIIGVVAALTIPNLNGSTNDMEKVAKVKKVYANLTEAYERATAVYGPINTWFTEYGSDRAKSSLRMGERITEFMKVSKICKYDKGCFSEKPLLNVKGGVEFDNYYEELLYTPLPMYILADGTSVAFYGFNFSGHPIGYIYVDIDGPNKGKNMEGYDLFKFDINQSKDCSISPNIFGSFRDSNSEFYVDNEYNFPTLWIIEYGNLDYLKCIDDLKWNTKTSCK